MSMIAARALRCRPAVSCLGTRQDATWATILTPAALVGALESLQRDATEKVASVMKSVEKAVEKTNVEVFKSIERLEKTKRRSLQVVRDVPHQKT